ncbi:MAG: Na/Pi cotransporter family protein [Thermodesulfobacteriota bacterium]
MGEILGNLIGGIGIFFVGLRMITTGLKQMTGRRLRMLFAKWTGTDFRAGLVGLLLGFISQSSAFAFIVASLIATGIMSVRNGLPIILWANAGAAVVVLLAVLNIKTLILFVLGVAGISVAFEKPARYHYLAGTLFGIGLLFYGLIMIRTGTAPLADKEWFKSMLLHGHHSFLLAFLMGALLTAISQSSVGVMILAITFTQSGLLSVEQTIMIIYGAHFGSSAITWILSAGLKGKPKQLVMAQVIFNLAGCAVLVPLFYLEIYVHIPLVEALVRKTSALLVYQMAYVVLLFNWGVAIVLSLLINPMAKLLAHFWLPTREESWSQLRYLQDYTLRDPETALTLISKEQTRLLNRLPLYIGELRSASSGERKPAYDFIHSAFQTVAREIQAFASDLLSQKLTHETSERALNIQNKPFWKGLKKLSTNWFYLLIAGPNRWSASD